MAFRPGERAGRVLKHALPVIFFQLCVRACSGISAFQKIVSRDWWEG